MIQKRMQGKNLDAILIFNFGVDLDTNFFYFSKFTGNGIFVIPKKKKPFLIVTEMDAAKITSRNKVVYKSGDLAEFILKTLKKKGIRSKNIGLDFNSVSVRRLRSLESKIKAKYIDVSSLIVEEREVKTKKEVEYIHRSSLVASMVIAKCIKQFKHFKTEADVHHFLDFQTKKFGCEFSFDPIVASGTGSAIPHYDDRKKLSRGFCVIDYGVKYKRYCCDMTRTIFLGHPTKEEIEDYNLVVKLQNMAISKIAVGMKASDLDKFVRDEMGKKAKYFIHSLGHGVGLDIHEAPTLSTNSDAILKKGMVVAIEPGLYFPKKHGIRIEDTIYLGNEVKVLSNYTKDLKIID